MWPSGPGISWKASVFTPRSSACGKQYLELFSGGTREGTEGKDVIGFCHICVMTKDIHRSYEAVKAAGGPVDREIQRGKSQCWMFWTHDPDGTQIEVMEMPPESLQAQADARLGTGI